MLFMVLELLEGAPLAAIIAHEGPMIPTRVAGIGRQIAKSLGEAHALGIIHRDLKPDNIFICNYHGEPDFVKVMDFGIARVLTVEDNMTRTGMMIGTPKYMAPEQAMARRVGPTADIYALGIMLHEMLTGSPPFIADSGMALALAHIHEDPPPLPMPGLPGPLADAWRGLVKSMLSKNPDHRPQRASDVAQWLQQLEAETQRYFDYQYGSGHDPQPSQAAWSHGTRSRPAPVPIETLSLRVADTPPPGFNLPGYTGPAWNSSETVATWAVPADASAEQRRPRRRRRRQRALMWAAIVFMVAGGIVAAILLKPVRRNNIDTAPPPSGSQTLDPTPR
jgi:serine/threonine-protein kinase